MMSYTDSAALMTNPVFRGRVKVACLTFASAINIEGPDVPAHNARLRWASQTIGNPDLVAGQIQPPTVMDPAVQAAGGDVTDAALQGAVETVVNTIL